MPQYVRGVVALAKGEPVTVETIVVPDPGPGQAVVKVRACGHTDLHYREGGVNDDFPFLLGHEAAGTVEPVGQQVTEVVPGDFVILNWRAVYGNCGACRRDRPWACFATHNAAQKMTLAGGTSRTTLGEAPNSRRHWASAPSPRRPSSWPASAPKADPQNVGERPETYGIPAPQLPATTQEATG
jgi:Zn-dependent alcohol dehydrogenase